jgi:LysM repeat protein
LVLGKYCHPAPYKIYSKYGMRRRRMHRGVDLAYPMGTPVVAAFDGMVRVSKANAGGYGQLIVIRHDNKLETYYGHLSQRLVNPGQMVHAGDTIALGGSTGRSTGPHLHFETRYLGYDFNPTKIIDFDNFKLKVDTLYTSGFEVTSKSLIAEKTANDAKASTSSSGTVYHKVRRGETLGSIAKKYHTYVSTIKKLNGLKSDFIREGQRLRVR